MPTAWREPRLEKATFPKVLGRLAVTRELREDDSGKLALSAPSRHHGAYHYVKLKRSASIQAAEGDGPIFIEGNKSRPKTQPKT